MENNKVTTRPQLWNWVQEPLNALQTIKTETLAQAVEAQSLPLISIEIACPGTGVDILTVLISEVVLFFNVGKNMNQSQIIQTAKLILTDEEAKGLKPEDFVVLFKNAKQGRYGKIYDRLDGQVVFEWVRAYVGERMAFCEENNFNQHQQKKKADNLVHPEVIEMYKKIIGEVKEIEVKEVEKVRTKPLKSERDLKIQELFMEFDKLKGEELRGKKYVNGLDQVEYVELKIKDYDEEVYNRNKEQGNLD